MRCTRPCSPTGGRRRGTMSRPSSRSATMGFVGSDPLMPHSTDTEWFAHAPHGPGLSFSCTMCGNCCTGPEGYVVVSDAEAAALAARLGLSVEDFLSRYTHKTSHGRSLKEHRTEFGLDCIFLDRSKVPGKAVCGVY